MVNLAVIGAGLIGKAHVVAIGGVPGARLACIVDPAAEARDFATSHGVPYYSSITAMFAAKQIDGAILATPSQLHPEGALACIAQGCAVLVEKPLATNIADAQAIVAAGQAADVAVLTGHHRRHGALVKTVKSLVESGVLGTITTFNATCWFHKPDDYFDVAWRSLPGGGPVFINAIHDIDTMRHLFGEVASVSAVTSNNIRGRTAGGTAASAVEDSAAIVLRFHSGTLGTLTVSDATVSPWSWEMTSGENPGFPETSQACYQIGGTKASLSVPDMRLWHHRGPPSWLNPLEQEVIAVTGDDPLKAQIQQFAEVIRGRAPPLVSGADGVQTLRVIDAVTRSAAEGITVML